MLGLIFKILINTKTIAHFPTWFIYKWYLHTYIHILIAKNLPQIIAKKSISGSHEMYLQVHQGAPEAQVLHLSPERPANKQDKENELKISDAR